MLTEDSAHTQSLRYAPSPFSTSDEDILRLRVPRFLDLLRTRDTRNTTYEKAEVKGKKRTLEEYLDNAPRKRIKVSQNVCISGTEDDREKLLPVYRRVLNVRFTTAYIPDASGCYLDDETAEKRGWAKHEQELCAYLSSYDPADSVIPLGTSTINDAGDVLDPRDESRVLFPLPTNSHYPFDTGDHDFHTRGYAIRDPLNAFLLLARDGRARLRAELSVVLLAGDRSVQEGALPFTLRVQVDCSLVCPRIFEPVIPSTRAHVDQTRASAVQEAQRRVFLHVFPPQTTLPGTYGGTTNIPLLFSVLGPAPPLLSSQALDTLQPDALLPTLLPFQRRSISWMLGREGKTVTASGEIVLQSDGDSDGRPLPLFWEAVSVSAEETWYVNRIRGVVSATRPTAEDDELNEDALGGIVAEEPGLGKTLECISTIILNPALDRSPANTRWDSETKIDVKEIRTTLIVTPPSLAPQWADELAAHAPGLKVLIYDGWQKVPVPVTEQDIEAAREKLLKRKAKGKARVSKAKRGSKGKGAAPSDAMDDEEMPVDDDEDLEVQDWCTYVNTFDVCITTYAVLQHDLGVARPPPSRPRRAFVDYGHTARARSPLVQCEWYRVIMDEVQMVGGGKTEEMVSLIPRKSSFAVSGTPARSQVSDLIHVLKFLRVKAVTDYPRAWTRLLLPGYVHEFVELFRRYAVRTMKTAVKDELTIPLQTRYLVPIELGRVEQHVYDQTLDAALLDLGLDARGVAATENREVDVAKLRHWLRRLRGICTHPQVGQLMAHGGADKLHKPGVLKSMAEVLESMREQNWKNYMDDRKSKVSTMASLAQLLQRDDTKLNRYRESLDILLTAETDAQKLVSDLHDVLAEHTKEGEKLKTETARLREERRQAAHNHSEDDGKGKGRARSDTPAHESVDADEEGLPHNSVGDAHRTKATGLQNRIRDARIVLHKVKFLQGDVYHVLGAQYANQENDAYAAAEELRRVLLKGTEEAAERAMTYLDRDPVVKALKEQDLFVKLPYLEKGGIKSHMLISEANELIEGLLNEQSKLLWQWRTKLIALLTQPLGSNDQDADGQEYTRSLDTQGEAEAYLQAYAALLADRRETLTAERTLLAAHDVREVKARKTKAARGTRYLSMLEAEVVDLDLDKLEDHDIQPEHQVMLKTLNDERKALLDDFDPGRAVKTIMVELNNIAVGIAKEDDPEKIISKGAVAKLRSLIAEQGKLIDKLQNDLAHFRKAFNERISYFRQLQEISDTVAEADWEGDVQDAAQDLREQQTALETKINTARARQRYMENLSRSHEEGTMDEDEKTCILCKCDFVRGYLTACAHVYCESCLKAWLAKAGGKACPVCRVPINIDQLQRFTIDQQPGTTSQPPPKILSNSEVVPRSRREIQYNFVNPQIMQDVQAMESYGSYGSKIETLIRHLLYLEVTDPGAKSIVFSAWADSLLIIQHALQANGISCLRIDQHTGKKNAAKRFRTDPGISVLLLHGERENAGLNVTCASRVFLVESVVHHAFEVQAIARIDRMGQTKPTEVYCYYAEDTVERNILDLAAKQGLSLYTTDNAAGTLNVTPFAADNDKKKVDAPAKKVQKGDFVYKTDDMLAILFPHLYEDLEYLVPPEELAPQGAPQGTGSGVQDSSPSAMRTVSVQENAVAGPSRVR
ncbi:SNF2 family N-terminal domain-containing protein [Lenzites betulinus]|nr:SNF2 family N-terminal domain-containing protein [Lenzites betulinus]